MRLIRLKIHNIASLKGEHLIDFEAIQSQTSLFAITGETGSGKSSILNAIGLALYGQVYKKNVNHLDVVTLGEKEGQAELIFQSHGKFYLADWRAKVRKQNGELLKQPLSQRYIYPINNSDFNAQKGQPIESVESLLHLDFDQFCKCIILNQGEFARFLSSNFTDRKEILEKLYPGEMFDNLSRTLRQDIEIINKEKNELEVELGTLKSDGLSGEDLKKEESTLLEKLNQQEVWLNRTRKLQDNYHSLVNYHEKFGENSRRKNLILEEIKNGTTVFNAALKKTQVSHEIWQELKDLQQKKLPRLQELLKVEESYKIRQTQVQDLKIKISENEKVLKLKEAHYRELEQETKKWESEHSNLVKEFVNSPQYLKSNEANFSLFLEQKAALDQLTKDQLRLEEAIKADEESGKLLAQEKEEIKEELNNIPQDLPSLIESLQTKKNQAQSFLDHKIKRDHNLENLKSIIDELEDEKTKLITKIELNTKRVNDLRNEEANLNAIKELYLFQRSIESCLDVAHKDQLSECPVCQQDVLPSQWAKLMDSLKKTDNDFTLRRGDALKEELIQTEEGLKISQELKENLEQSISERRSELEKLTSSSQTEEPDLISIEQDLNEKRDLLKKREFLEKDQLRIEKRLREAREIYQKKKQELSVVSLELKVKSDLSEKFLTIHSPFLSQVEVLKDDLRLLNRYQQSESKGARLQQSEKFSQGEIERLKTELSKQQENLRSETFILNQNAEILKSELNDQSAVVLIDKIAKNLKEAEENYTRDEKSQKAIELNLKEWQGKLYSVDEHLKDIDFQFTKTLHIIREDSLDLPPEQFPQLRALFKKMRDLALDLASAYDFFAPLKDLILEQKSKLEHELNLVRETRAHVVARLQDWEKRQDRIELLNLKLTDLTQNLDRQLRLFEVLGKDELRSFVLSLVEENLITQTNKELERLCQGRYEIIHQTKGSQRTPEFYVLDKYREGGKRKVSTLSGGETFMVSLAMALALAELTRGQAEIDSLFIDEGFGTLDQESLEDVIEVLNHIQTRGLLVGIISHIKSLTNALQVNLNLSKRADGTSAIGILYN
jgi:DNA repair protein SbcC/Rad50